MTETALMRDILVAVNRLPQGLFWRVNVGLGARPDGQNADRQTVPTTGSLAARR
jgi:hypothetical protein